ncbi:MAG: M48 family metallopeptidase [Deltaproteobacteria bacterium]|nr:M48 family metallopeptidase [Deltaproteobacteria bacterium]
MQSRSLAGRAALAVALMIGFYVLALAMIAALLFVPYVEVAWAHHVNLKLTLLCLFGAAAIGWSILPRGDTFPAPGPALHEGDHPRLFDRLRDVATRTEQAMPSEVFLVPDMNAWVANRGGVMGFGSRRVMGLGLPLMQLTQVDQFEAILAHEFGHYHGGDTRLGPWIYKTRGAIGRTLGTLGEDGWLHLPFRWYGTMFLRITQAISRAQELTADRLAARVVGARPLADGLKRVHAEGQAFNTYWQNEAVPLLQAGYHAPLVEGFTRFLQAPRIRTAIDKALATEMESGTADPFDSHPPLRERLAALAPLLDVDAPVGDEASALTLLGDVAASERALIGFLAKSGDAGSFRPLAWDDTTLTVYAPAWRQQMEKLAPLLGDATLADLPEIVRTRGAELSRHVAGQEVPEQFTAQALAGPLGSCVATALLDAGWSADAAPGEPVTVRHGDFVLEPFAIVPSLLGDQAAAGSERWLTTLREHDVAALRLATPPATVPPA